MKRKINRGMLQLALLAIAATFLIITAVYYSLFRNQVINDLAISAKLIEASHYFDDTSIDTSTIHLSDEIEELRVTWIDVDGQVLYDNGYDVSSMENHNSRPEINEARDTGSGQSMRHSNTLNQNTFYYALLLKNGTVVRVSTDASNILSVYLSVIPILILIIVIIIFIAVQISHVLTTQLISPIEDMARHMEDSDNKAPYKELEPFAAMIRKQHLDILMAAQARQDFTANVSHELKTPLTAITGYAELINNNMVDKDQEKHFIVEIIKNSNRLLSLIDDILRLSDLDRTEENTLTETVDLYTIVEECMDELTVNAMKREVELQFAGDHTNVRGDSGMLKELVENLVQNAIRYNNPGGHVWVSVKNEDGPCLIVKDDGIGIPEADQGRIFERFYRVDKSRSKATGGTGLGLAIVKHIVEIHSAKLTLASSPGKGSVFSVHF